MQRSTSSPYLKSRNGCLRCKAKKVKCDEQKPACSRCEDRGFKCPGYALSIRWSHRHQLQSGRPLTEKRVAQGALLRQCQANASVDGAQRTPPESVEQVDLHNSAASIGAPQSPDCVSEDVRWASDISPLEPGSLDHSLRNNLIQNEAIMDHPPLPSNDFSWDDDPFSLLELPWTNIGNGPIPSVETDPRAISQPMNNLFASVEATQMFNQMVPLGPSNRSMSRMTTDIVNRNNERPPPLTIPKEPSNLTTSLSEYFFRHVITLYCVWDGESNMLRNIIENDWQSSGALHHTIRSMAAACLSQDFPSLSKTAKQEHLEALQYIQAGEGQQRTQQDLVACMLHGHTSSWLNPHDLAVDMFGASSSILATLDQEDSDGINDLSFFHDTMEYWAMLLSFLVVGENFGRYRKERLVKASAEPLAKPHPYSGISRETVKILADTGSLIFKYRQHMSKVRFMEEKDLDVFRMTLRKARSLERRLLAHRPPNVSSIADPGDTKTPLHHFTLMDQAYQYTGLLQIYRVFPDLLSERYSPWNVHDVVQPPPAVKVPTVRERNDWLMQLAVHVLEILEKIPFESRTRSGQPFIMVAVSSELRRDVGDDLTSGQDTGLSAISNVSLKAMQARRFIRSRLGAYAQILPLAKVSVISDLVDHIWTMLDSGEQDVYWLDVAAKEGLGTMMG